MINKAILLGTVESVPLINRLPNGTRVANFTLVTEERWVDRHTGEQRVKSERHKIAVFVDKVAAMIEEQVEEGALVFVEGMLETRNWVDSSGVTRQSFDIVVRPMRGTITIMDSYLEDAPHEYEADTTPL